MSEPNYPSYPTDPNEIHSIVVDSHHQAMTHKWILSEKQQRDAGVSAVENWRREHWARYLRERFVEHIQGRRFWKELDKEDFGLLRRGFQEDQLLVDRIVDRLIVGQENLNVINWALDYGIDTEKVWHILRAIDVNSRRLTISLETLMHYSPHHTLIPV